MYLSGRAAQESADLQLFRSVEVGAWRGAAYSSRWLISLPKKEQFYTGIRTPGPVACAKTDL